jgi:hypothetical protein
VLYITGEKQTASIMQIQILKSTSFVGFWFRSGPLWITCTNFGFVQWLGRKIRILIMTVYIWLFCVILFTYRQE